MNKFIVITTVNPANDVIRKYASMEGWKLIVVGDRKGPKEWDEDRAVFLDIEEQAELGLDYPRYCRENHYARKNVGYLYAMMNGADVIAETDDDNMPMGNWGKVGFENQNVSLVSGGQFFNVFSLFNDTIWPRGYPLELVQTENRFVREPKIRDIGVWNYFIDHDPDVDAVYRMTIGDKVSWPNFKPFCLEKNTYCPFNSQNTFWTKETFPLMYLPQTVNQRYCDILRGYIAQRLMWEKNLHLGFGPATVKQVRNYHDLFKDFLDEIPMYKTVGRLVETLNEFNFTHYESFSEMMVTVYGMMRGIVGGDELAALDAWNQDIKEIYENSTDVRHTTREPVSQGASSCD